MGSLGEPIPYPEVIQVLAQQTKPKPLRAYTQQELNSFVGSDSGAYFRMPPGGFWNGKDLLSLAKGSRVLWKSGASGKRGGDSTKVEVFSGIVHDWAGDQFIVLS
jgi:hypothetical protein